MSLLNTLLKYLKIKKELRETEIITYDSLNDPNYFESFNPVVLETDFKGTLVCSGEIHIKKHASFSGHLICRTCRIEGKFSGSLLSTEHTAVCNTAVLDAKIVAGSILIESNAVVTGNFNITKNIVNPEAIRKLEDIYNKSVPTDADPGLTGPVPAKTLILKGKPKHIASAGRAQESLPPAPPPRLEEQAASLGTKKTPEHEMNRKQQQPIVPAQPGGWW